MCSGRKSRVSFQRISSNVEPYVGSTAQDKGIYVGSPETMGTPHPDALVGPKVYTRDFAYSDNNNTSGYRDNDSSDQMKASRATRSGSMGFAELLSGPTIDVVVGQKRRRWTLHLNLLRQHSNYFSQQHEDEATLSLTDDDPDGFALLVQWLYQGYVQYPNESSTDEERYNHAVACHRLHILAARFQLSQLSNIAVDRYRRCLYETKLVPDAKEIDEIYRSSPTGSPFRKLMVQIAARQLMDPETRRNPSDYRPCFEGNADFAIELFDTIRNISGGILFPDPTAPGGDGCQWHDHSDGSKCPTIMQANQSRRRLSQPAKRSDIARFTTGSPNSTHHNIAVPHNTPHNFADSAQSRAIGQPLAHQLASLRPRSVSSGYQTPQKYTKAVNGMINGFNNMKVAHNPNARGQTLSSNAGGGVKKRKPPQKLRRGSTSTTTKSAQG